MAKFKFTLENTSQNARAGRIEFENGITVETPVFMPVGTQATVKAIPQEYLKEIDFNIILGNTYHLYLRPGVDVISSFKGLKNFMSWDRAMLTDSGGFQAFSLSENSQYRKDGVMFKSHIDGSYHLFTPEKVADIQWVLGADIVMPIDDCAPYPANEKRIVQSLDRTHRWLKNIHDYIKLNHYDEHQNLFGIVQGSINEKFRKESAYAVIENDLPGYAIGGLSVGENKEDFLIALNAVMPILPKNKPRYIMGVGSIREIINSIELGVDMMDCVLPTRNARNGQVFTSYGKVNLRNKQHAHSSKPIDDSCGCMVCQNYSIGYIRHLHKAQELLAYTLSSYHNLYFMKNFMTSMRNSILNNKFSSFKKEWFDKYQ